MTSIDNATFPLLFSKLVSISALVGKHKPLDVNVDIPSSILHSAEHELKICTTLTDDDINTLINGGEEAACHIVRNKSLTYFRRVLRTYTSSLHM